MWKVVQMSPESQKLNAPAFLAPLDDERARIERILGRLDETTDLTERADLGSELVRSASRYEDTLERGVWSTLPDPPPAAVAGLEDDRAALREVMVTIHEATMHVDPRNVHAPDPQGFEDALSDVCVRLRALLAKEDRAVADLAAQDTPEVSAQRTEAVARAFKHASERPVPPKTAIGRFVANANVKLDHTFEDVATPQHPGADTIDGDPAPDA